MYTSPKTAPAAALGAGSSQGPADVGSRTGSGCAACHLQGKLGFRVHTFLTLQA